jgi:hypothetical protein
MGAWNKHEYGMFLAWNCISSNSCRIHATASPFMPGIFSLGMFLACLWHETVPLQIHAAFMLLSCQVYGMFLAWNCISSPSCRIHATTSPFMPGIFSLGMFLACLWHETVPLQIHAAFMLLSCQVYGMFLAWNCISSPSCRIHATTSPFMPGIFSLGMFLACLWHETVPLQIHAAFMLHSCQVYSH